MYDEMTCKDYCETCPFIETCLMKWFKCEEVPYV